VMDFATPVEPLVLTEIDCASDNAAIACGIDHCALI